MATVRGECLDWTLGLGRNHLERVLRAYVRHYNEARPHRGLRLKVPAGVEEPVEPQRTAPKVNRRAILGGLIHEYAAA